MGLPMGVETLTAPARPRTEARQASSRRALEPLAFNIVPPEVDEDGFIALDWLIWLWL